MPNDNNGQDDVFLSMATLQQAVNKWFPRALEMFGDERGGGTNVKWGFKPLKNGAAQEQYLKEVEKVVRDLNMRYLRARLPELALAGAEAAMARLEAGEAVDGVRSEELLRVPHPEFFRRRGIPAFRKVGVAGERFDILEDYLRHLARVLPDGYRATRDFQDFVELSAAVGARREEPGAGAEADAAAAPRGGSLPVLARGALGRRGSDRAAGRRRTLNRRTGVSP